MPKPSVGRIVYYVSYGTPGGEYSRECRGLCVLNPTGQFFNRHVHGDSGCTDDAGGTNLCDGLDWPAHV
jgi:hypothetical protein